MSVTRQRVADFVALTKPRVVAMVLVTTWVGFYLGSLGFGHAELLIPLMVGTALAAGGTLTLNQYMERDVDALMRRTRERPLPAGRLEPGEALVFGLVLTVGGPLYIWAAVNFVTAATIASISASYLLFYTPMKRTTPLCSVVGAVPGALPPMAGWAAARGSLDIEAWILFAIMFLWQLPHSLAIAQLYRDDYAGAGFRLLPVLEEDCRSTSWHVVSNSLALVMVALMPTFVGMAGAVYFVAALILSGMLLWYGIVFARFRNRDAARQLMLASLIYLPALLLIMALDKAPLQSLVG